MSSNGTGAIAVAPFDPSRHLSKIGSADYLEVRWRLVWLRHDHPDADIDTELVSITDAAALFKARISIPGGGAASGFGSETPKDFRDYIEKAECLTLSTQILTRRGFVAVYDLVPGEDVLAYDPATERNAWTPLIEAKVYQDADVIEVSTGHFRARMTPDHSWVVKGRGLMPMSGIKTSDTVVIAAPGPGGDSPVTPHEAAVLGWLFTDGTIKRTGNIIRGAITQSKPATVAVIRGLLPDATETVGLPTTRTFPSGRTYDCLPQHTFGLPAALVRMLFEKAEITGSEDLPELATRLTAEARRAMLDAMMQADGDAKGNFGKKRKPGVQECWQILCTLEGIAVGRRRNEQRFAVQRAKKRQTLSASQFQRRDAGQATVWCPTTQHGTWVARLESGQIVITGNTKAVGRALVALGYGTAFCSDFDGDGANGRVADSPVERRQPARTTVAAQHAPGDTSTAAAPPPKPVTPGQLKALWTAADHTIGAADKEAAVRGLLALRGLESTKELTHGQAAKLIDYLTQTPKADILKVAKVKADATHGQPELPVEGSRAPTPEEAALINFRERADESNDWGLLYLEAGVSHHHWAALAEASSTIGQLNAVIDQVKKKGLYTKVIITAEQRVRPRLEQRAAALTR